MRFVNSAGGASPIVCSRDIVKFVIFSCFSFKAMLAHLKILGIIGAIHCNVDAFLCCKNNQMSTKLIGRKRTPFSKLLVLILQRFFIRANIYRKDIAVKSANFVIQKKTDIGRAGERAWKCAHTNSRVMYPYNMLI